MARANLRERDPKTQTRRLRGLSHVNVRPDAWRLKEFANGVGEFVCIGEPTDDWFPGQVHRVKCPYGMAGDRIWQRETHSIQSVDGLTAWLSFKERMPHGKTLAETDGGLDEFKLTPEQAKWARENRDTERWRPGIHMPRWACRFVAELLDVRVQRLHQITEEDAIAEGLVRHDGEIETWFGAGLDGGSGLNACRFLSAVECYRELWDHINAKICPWKSNPYVWCLIYRRTHAHG